MICEKHFSLFRRITRPIEIDRIDAWKAIFELKAFYALCSIVSTFFALLVCFTDVMKNTKISFRYCKAVCHFTTVKCTFMARWNISNAFLSLEDTPMYVFRPWWDVKEVFFFLFFPLPSIYRCLYLVAEPNSENSVASSRKLLHHSFLVSGMNPAGLLCLIFCSQSTSVKNQIVLEETRIVKTIQLWPLRWLLDGAFLQFRRSEICKL